MEDSRRTSSGRRMPKSYWQASDVGLLDSDDPISVNSRIIDLENDAVGYGFTGLFEAVVAMVKSEAPAFQEGRKSFIHSGGLAELISACISSPRSVDEIPAGLGQVILETAGHLYLKEWRRLTSHPDFRRPLTSFSAEYVDKFSFSKIYQDMVSCAPSLIQLFTRLTSKPSVSEASATPEAVEDKRQRFVVTSLCILGRQQNQQFNVFQGFCTIFLFANNTPKRVIEVLNQLGISTSYTSLMRGLDSNAKHFRQRLRGICEMGIAPLIVMDNIQFKANVRDQRVMNQASFITSTAGYVLIPSTTHRHEMFTPADCKYDLVHRLTARDFFPTQADQEIIEMGFRSLIWDVVRSSTKAHGVRAPRIKFPMPSVFPLDRRQSPEILPLRTYHLDEGMIDELIKILYNVQADIGLSDEQATSKTVPFRGDLLTTLQYRYSFFVLD
jgi:hypothetical protein